MQTVDERPDLIEEKPETIHLYVVREEEPHPSILPIFLSLAALSVLFTLCVFSPYQQPEVRKTIRVPAVLLPLQILSTTVAVIPTGITTYPATTAHGTLTITNGSVISQAFPSGMLFSGTNGIQVETDTAVFIPPGSANGYGYATVSAHALIRGKHGNIPAYAINRVEGSSTYIRNLAPFTGGHDAYSVLVVTAQDRQTALEQARNVLFNHTVGNILIAPCQEAQNTTKGFLHVIWQCQFVTYAIPSFMKVTHVRISGTYLVLDVVFIARPRPFPGK